MDAQNTNSNNANSIVVQKEILSAQMLYIR